jgi:hypothetical protein
MADMCEIKCDACSERVACDEKNERANKLALGIFKLVTIGDSKEQEVFFSQDEALAALALASGALIAASEPDGAAAGNTLGRFMRAVINSIANAKSSGLDNTIQRVPPRSAMS